MKNRNYIGLGIAMGVGIGLAIGAGLTQKKKGKKKGLPPGIAKNLQRGKPLPPGIAKRDLPSGLESSLPGKHDGYESLIVGNDVVLVEIDTGKIADIITDAVLGN